MNPVVKSTKETVFPHHSSIDHTVSIIFEGWDVARRIYSLTTELSKC